MSAFSFGLKIIWLGSIGLALILVLSDGDVYGQAAPPKLIAPLTAETLGRKPLNQYGSLEQSIQTLRSHRPLDLNAETWRKAHREGPKPWPANKRQWLVSIDFSMGRSVEGKLRQQVNVLVWIPLALALDANSLEQSSPIALPEAVAPDDGANLTRPIDPLICRQEKLTIDGTGCILSR